MVLGETGRESKFQREAFDILQHYFYHSSTVTNTNQEKLDIDTETATGIQNSTGTEAGDSHKSNTDSPLNPLSLEDEIAMLRKGASADAVLLGLGKESSVDKPKVPFRVYDTGCRGSVFIMCTMDHCELIKTKVSTAKHLHASIGDKDGSSLVGEEEQCTISKQPECHLDETIKNDLNESVATTRKRKEAEGTTKDDDDDDDTIPHDCSTTVHLKKHKATRYHGETDDDNPDAAKGGKWDPVETVNAIFRDIREKNKMVPRSRFVNRIIPIQVTCFASMEEIKANAQELIQKFLFPVGIQCYENRKDIQEENGSLPSFKIDFRRRNCNHIRREPVVETIAGILQMLTDDYWKQTASAESIQQEKDGGEHVNKALFRVDLKDPQYTIVIEICRTLCGMSIVKDAKSYRNFNLLVVQEEVGESC